MTLVPIKGLKRFTAKGRTYIYHRATSTRIKSPEGSAAFIMEVDALDKKAAQQKLLAGTASLLIKEYKTTPAWGRLAEATRVSYDRAFAVIEAGFGSRKLVEITPPFVAKYRDIVDRKRGRWMANYFLTVLGILCDFARERGMMVGENPVKSVKRVPADRNRAIANRPWTKAECRAVLDAAPLYLKVPIGLAMFAGFRKGDVLKIQTIEIETRSVEVDGKNVEIDFIVRSTKKRGVEVAFPVHFELAAILADAPKNTDAKNSGIIAVNSYGKPWTESGFNSTFGKLIDRLEASDDVKPGLTMHGLRHTAGTRLYEAGADLEMIGRLLGQKSQAMARHYSQTADSSAATARIVGGMKVLEGRAK